MRKFILYLFVIGNWGILYGQSSLSGSVIDGSNREPIPFATLYIDGTTRGETTDENGQFTFALNGIELPAVLVVSHIGYSPLSLQIDENTPHKLELVLQPRTQLMNTVVVQDLNRRQENLIEFRRLFLGEDTWGKRARIRNEEALIFERDYKERKVKIYSNQVKRRLINTELPGMKWASDSSHVVYNKAQNLKASANAPLLIDLPDLGYTLQLDLVSFHMEYEQGRTGYLGYYFFKPYEGQDGKVSARHRRNRERAYFHSPQHFLRALFNRNLADNGYQLLEQKGEKAPYSLKTFDPEPFLHLTEKDRMAIRGLKDQVLIILYYANRKGRPLPASKWKRAQPLQSGIHFEADECLIRADGTIGDSKLLFSGHLGQRGLAWSLPGNYE